MSRKKSPNKSRVARARRRGPDGLFLSGSGHRRSTGRYAGMSGDLVNAGYARLNALHDERHRLDTAAIDLEQARARRQLDQKLRAAQVQHEADRQTADERAAEARRQVEARATETAREAERAAAEAQERAAKQTIDREKRFADEQIKQTEAWVKTLVPEIAR